MSSTQMGNERVNRLTNATMVDTKLEVVTVPVSDVERAKHFYGSLGWRLDADFSNGKDWRAIQMTPPGSPCAIIFGTGVTTISPGSVQGRAPGPDPEGGSYRSWASFSDPDGNGWLLQEVKTRLSGRGLSLDVATLTDLLREAEEQHGVYEASAPKHHWSGWYAAYIIARERGKTPEEAADHAALHMEAARH